MKEKPSVWKRIFVLPPVPTLVIMVLAAALLVFALRRGYNDIRGAGIYMFSTYALILACTGYARLMERWPILKKIFTLPLIPSLLIIIIGAAMIIYVFSAQDFGPFKYVAYLVSAYAVVLAVTTYVRMFREFSHSEYAVSVDGPGRRSYAVKSRALNGFLSELLVPFLEVAGVSFRYSMSRILRGAAEGNVGRIVLAMLTVIALIAMMVLGPLFFLIGLACVFWWTGQLVRGIVLCALGLVFIVLSSKLAMLMAQRQKEALTSGAR